MSFRLWYCGYAYSCVWNYSWAFLTISIYAHYYGVLFAGEANAGYHTDLYNCTFPAMVADWRQNFYQGSGGHNERIFPFGFVQVQPGCGQWHVIEIWKIADIKFELQFSIQDRDSHTGVLCTWIYRSFQQYIHCYRLSLQWGSLYSGQWNSSQRCLLIYLSTCRQCIYQYWLR